jgi:hypothetical protein
VLVGVLSKDALGPLSIGAVGLTGQGDERDDLEKSDGPSINLLAGIGMVFGPAPRPFSCGPGCVPSRCRSARTVKASVRNGKKRPQRRKNGHTFS